MTDPKPKRQRNSSSELTIGEATTRILATRAEVASALAKARQEVLDRYVGKEATILMRVAEEARGIVRARVDKVAAPDVIDGEFRDPAVDGDDQPTPAELDAEAPDEDPEPEAATSEPDEPLPRGAQPYVPSAIAQAARGRGR